MVKKLSVETLCDRELLEEIYHLLKKRDKLHISSVEPEGRLYDNKSLMAKLGIKEKYLKKLRDKGYLGYSREGDKYWYTQEDLNRFLCRFHYEAFAVDDVFSNLEGGEHVR